MSRLFGTILVICAGSTAAAAPPRPDSFVELPRMRDARSGQATFALSDGRAVVAGGEGVDGTLSSCEIFGGARDRTWAPYPSLPIPLHGTFAATLADDILLVAGGVSDDDVMSDRAFISDARRGSHEWVEIARLPFPMAITHVFSNGATLLQDGKVLLVGGLSLDQSGPDPDTLLQASDLAVVYTPDSTDPRRGTFDVTRDLTAERLPLHSGRGGAIEVEPGDGDFPRAARLRVEGGGFRPEDQGQPIAISGSVGNDSPPGGPFLVYKFVSSTEILYWNPRGAKRERSFRGTWTIGGRRPETRAPRRLAIVPLLLASGEVFRVGGIDRSDRPSRADHDRFDPRTGRWTLHDAPHELLPPVHGDVVGTGAGDRIVALGDEDGSARLVDPSARFSPADVARWITISDAIHTGNDGSFQIGAVEDAHTVTYANASAVNEDFGGRWTIRDGEDPVTATSSGRDHGAAALLPDGQVLVAGGFSSWIYPPGVQRRSAFIFDPTRPWRGWRRTGFMLERRYDAKAFTGPGGAIHVALSFDSSSTMPADGDPCDAIAIASTELFDPHRETWSLGASPPVERVILSDGGLACDLPVAGDVHVTPLATGHTLFTGGLYARDPNMQFPVVDAALLYTPGSL